MKILNILRSNSGGQTDAIRQNTSLQVTYLLRLNQLFESYIRQKVEELEARVAAQQARVPVEGDEDWPVGVEAGWPVETLPEQDEASQIETRPVESPEAETDWSGYAGDEFWPDKTEPSPPLESYPEQVESSQAETRPLETEADPPEAEPPPQNWEAVFVDQSEDAPEADGDDVTLDEAGQSNGSPASPVADDLAEIAEDDGPLDLPVEAAEGEADESNPETEGERETKVAEVESPLAVAQPQPENETDAMLTNATFTVNLAKAVDQPGDDENDDGQLDSESLLPAWLQTFAEQPPAEAETDGEKTITPDAFEPVSSPLLEAFPPPEIAGEPQIEKADDLKKDDEEGDGLDEEEIEMPLQVGAVEDWA